MLDAAFETVADVESGTIFHSDRGAHYSWPGWFTRIGDAKLVHSISRKGCPQDNAACEGSFGRLKTELVYPETGSPSQSRSLSARLMPTSDGATKSASNYLWAHAVPSSIGKALV
jgi:transposase InsO family protein